VQQDHVNRVRCSARSRGARSQAERGTARPAQPGRPGSVLHHPCSISPPMITRQLRAEAGPASRRRADIGPTPWRPSRGLIRSSRGSKSTSSRPKKCEPGDEGRAHNRSWISSGRRRSPGRSSSPPRRTPRQQAGLIRRVQIRCVCVLALAQARQRPPTRLAPCRMG
jgi:hypothetical protein